MSTTVDATDLTGLHDIELDAMLQMLYRQHKQAAKHERLEIHEFIIQVIAEQSTRLELWRNAKAAAG